LLNAPQPYKAEYYLMQTKRVFKECTFVRVEFNFYILSLQTSIIIMVYSILKKGIIPF